MESTGIPGGVHLSAETAALCDLPQSVRRDRRSVDVKGRGTMDTYLVQGGGQEAAALLAVLPSGVSAMRHSSQLLLRGDAQYEALAIPFPGCAAAFAADGATPPPPACGTLRRIQPPGKFVAAAAAAHDHRCAADAGDALAASAAKAWAT
jgi:hypothetical protein